MPPEWVYHLGGVLLVLANGAAWGATFFTLPGNWIIVALMALAAFLLPEAVDGSLGVGWGEVMLLALLAGLGELAEFATGAAIAKKQGGSRRGMIISLGSAAVGSLLGAIVGIPIPFVGTALGALLGGAFGAYAGAYLGESWKGRDVEGRLAVSRAALVGRLMGTVGKLVIGIGMVAASLVMFWLV